MTASSPKKSSASAAVTTAPNNAQERTAALQRSSLSVDLLEPNPENPNEMGDAEFNLLYDNIARMGVTDPILVRPHPDKPGKYRVVGGHHRLEVAKLHDIKEVPCTIITDQEFDDEQERFQLVRMNMIRGKMAPEKFMKLYEQAAKKYGDDILREAFGFADEEAFNKLIGQTAKSLPKEMQQTFKDAAKELKTIDELAALLNKMFSTHGDTLPYGYMVVEFGGQDSIWLRLSKKSHKDFMTLALECKKAGVGMDALVEKLLHLSAMPEHADTLGGILASLPALEVALDVEVPTLDAAQ